MIVLPHRVEFGIKIRFYVPAFHALKSTDGTKVAYIEEGEEALYPSATEFRRVPRRNDDHRYGREDELKNQLKASYPPEAIVELTRGQWPEERFVPEPFTKTGFRGDVVICPRKRDYGSSKNWPHWDLLSRQPNVVAAGAPDSSYDGLDCPVAWQYPRFLDATIEAIRSARLVVSTDAGLAHLAVLCGTPLLMITHRGLVAPGPVVDEHGTVLRQRYWPVRLQRYYLAANHLNSPIYTVDGWEDPKKVVDAIKEITRS